MTPITKFSGKYRFLSNFFPCNIKDDYWLVYPSVEHAFQAAKSLDRKIRECFLNGSAGEAKIKGRRVEIRGDWEQVKVSVMKEFLRQKFTQEPLKTKLLETGDALLVEGNTWGDTFWGVCNGEGQNMLGKLLMEVRAELNPPNPPNPPKISDPPSF